MFWRRSRPQCRLFLHCSGRCRVLGCRIWYSVSLSFDPDLTHGHTRGPILSRSTRVLALCFRGHASVMVPVVLVASPRPVPCSWPIWPCWCARRFWRRISPRPLGLGGSFFRAPSQPPGWVKTFIVLLGTSCPTSLVFGRAPPVLSVRLL